MSHRLAHLSVSLSLFLSVGESLGLSVSVFVNDAAAKWLSRSKAAVPRSLKQNFVGWALRQRPALLQEAVNRQSLW